ncbi:MAG: hypothetical protein ACFE95_02745 [Candidatus Hodarchaeota archaeon]
MENDIECATSCDDHPAQLNVEMLEKVTKLIEKCGEDPIKKFIRDNGFDPDNGDLLVCPLKYKPKDWINLGHSNLVFSSFADDAFIMKNPVSFVFKASSKSLYTFYNVEDNVHTYLCGLRDSCCI